MKTNFSPSFVSSQNEKKANKKKDEEILFELHTALFVHLLQKLKNYIEKDKQNILHWLERF